ncbi:MAG: hypothetical protein Q8S75_19695 [Nitrospirota bacterium]|jgi:hypothetical protein|nr:hypothetical protein [Nitrospirota bacterium]
MHTRLLSTTLLVLVITFSLSTGILAHAESHSTSPDPVVSEAIVVQVTTWAPRGLTNSTTACDLAKEQALTHLGLSVKALQLVEQTGTTSFPSHLTCRWDETQHAYQTLLSITVPTLREPFSRTAHRMY